MRGDGLSVQYRAVKAKPWLEGLMLDRDFPGFPNFAAGAGCGGLDCVDLLPGILQAAEAQV